MLPRNCGNVFAFGVVVEAVTSLALMLLFTAWPDSSAELRPLEARQSLSRKVRVAIDAGHGAPGNEGNHGCFCQAEQEHTLAVADFLAAALEASGRFEVKRTRVGTEQPKYGARIAAAQAFKAEVIISLHSDARGWAEPVAQGDGGVCWVNAAAPGFAVLWNDEGPALAGREKLGRAVGARLREAGFLAYSGYDYGDLYTQDAVEPSGWIDKRPKKQRVYFLRASRIPTVIIETHHALDVDEVARWGEARTLDAFSRAVMVAILDVTN
jgi:N-acetylmuramoyl-L-alanine amidase